MGTIRINPNSVVQTGSWDISFGTAVSVLSGAGGDIRQTSIDQAICLGFPFAHTPGPGSYGLECSPGSSILLDAVPTTVNNLPAGFRVLALRVFISISATPNSCVSVLKITHDLSIIFSNPALSGVSSFNSSINLFGKSALGLFTDHWTFDCTFFEGQTANTGCGMLPFASAQDIISSLFITGTFDIFSSSITITPDPAVNGNTITIQSDGDLTEITRIKVKDEDNNEVQDVDSADFIEWTVFFLRFILDISSNISGTYYIEGTTFSGSVLLGSLEILVENGSGIYRIVPNKRNDTVYLSSAESPTTVDVKIPNPFGKTGFIGG